MISDLNLSAQVEGELIRNLNLGRHYGKGRNNKRHGYSARYFYREVLPVIWQRKMDGGKEICLILR